MLQFKMRTFGEKMTHFSKTPALSAESVRVSSEACGNAVSSLIVGCARIVLLSYGCVKQLHMVVVQDIEKAAAETKQENSLFAKDRA